MPPRRRRSSRRADDPRSPSASPSPAPRGRRSSRSALASPSPSPPPAARAPRTPRTPPRTPGRGDEEPPETPFNTFRVNREFTEEPRQMVVLLALLGALSYGALHYEGATPDESARAGFVAAAGTFLVYGFLQFRDSVLIRPHPGVWRVVHGCGVVYLLCLCALLVQSREAAIRTFQVVFPEVGRNPDRAPTSLVGNCTVTPATLWDQVTTLWFAAHIVGWWGKMVMYRSWRICWVLAVSFELLECSLQWIIPDFKECMVDSLGLDLLGANVIGMFLGHLTLRHLESKQYDWSGCRGARRVVMQFSPFSWSRYDWEIFQSPRRFLMVLATIIVALGSELNAFFVLMALDIPKESSFNFWRLWLIFALALLANSEYYDFVREPRRLGQNAWLVIALLVVEALIWIKFLPAELRLRRPEIDVWLPWTLFLVMFSLWFALFCRAAWAGRAARKDTFADGLFWASFAPLVTLVQHWDW